MPIDQMPGGQGDYREYVVDTEYMTDHGWVQLPAVDGATSPVCRVHEGYSQRRVLFKIVKAGNKPTDLPTKQPMAGETLLTEKVIARSATTNGLTPVWEVSGEYVFAMGQPPERYVFGNSPEFTVDEELYYDDQDMSGGPTGQPGLTNTKSGNTGPLGGGII